MRFSRRTLETVIAIGLLLSIVGYYLSNSELSLNGVNVNGLLVYGLYVFFGFSIDYLFRDKRFFKSKYYRIQLLGFALLIFSFGLLFADVPYGEFVTMASIGLIGLSYVAWAFDQDQVGWATILRAIISLSLIAYFLLSGLHLPYKNESLLIAFGACLVADIQNFIYVRPNLKKRLKM